MTKEHNGITVTEWSFNLIYLKTAMLIIWHHWIPNVTGDETAQREKTRFKNRDFEGGCIVSLQ